MQAAAAAAQSEPAATGTGGSSQRGAAPPGPVCQVLPAGRASYVYTSCCAAMGPFTFSCRQLYVSGYAACDHLVSSQTTGSGILAWSSMQQVLSCVEGMTLAINAFDRRLRMFITCIRTALSHAVTQSSALQYADGMVQAACGERFYKLSLQRMSKAVHAFH